MTEMQHIQDEHVSDISFDRAFADALSTAEQQRMHSHLRECPRCRTRHSELAEGRAAFLSAAPSWNEYSAQQGSGVRHLARPKRAATGKLWLTLSAATALAASALLMSSQLAKPVTHTRSKGSAQLGFYIKHGEQVSRGRPDQVVHSGDVLRFTYSSPEPTYFALLGRDEHSAILFYPVASQAVALPKGTDVPLGFGVEIDARSGQEHIFALFCAEPVPLAPVVSALDRANALTPPASCSVRELHLRKALP